MNSLFIKLAIDYYKGCQRLPEISRNDTTKGPSCKHGPAVLKTSKKENQNKGIKNYIKLEKKKKNRKKIEK